MAVRLSDSEARRLGVADAPGLAVAVPGEGPPPAVWTAGPGVPVLACWAGGQPVPWRPARVTRRGTYTPPHVREWQARVARAARAAYGAGPPHAGPCRLELDFVRLAPRGKRPGDHWGARPDLVNLSKAVEDSIQGIAFEDDRQVVEHAVTKRYGKASGVAIRVYLLGGGAS